MKKIFILLTLVIAILGSCKYDDSELWEKLNELSEKVDNLEKLYAEMNENVSALQSIVSALEKNDAIKDIIPLSDGQGYTITFVSGKTINIYNGTDGITPIIGVKQDSDGIYYWTINGEWLIVDNHKVKANGTDGITPLFKIESSFWFVSYNGGITWEKIGEATDTSCLFKEVYIKEGYVYFVLNDGISTVIKIPLLISNDILTIYINTAGTLPDLIGNDIKDKISKLKIIGPVNGTDVKFIREIIRNWEKEPMSLDLSESYIVKGGDAYYKDYYTADNEIGDWMFQMSNLSSLVLPKNITKIGDYAIEHCNRIESFIIPSTVTTIGNFAFEYCQALKNIEIPNSVKYIGEASFAYCVSLEYITLNNGLEEIDSWAFGACENLSNIYIPESVHTIGHSVFVRCNLLESINVDANNDFFICREGVLYSKDLSRIVSYPLNKDLTSYTILDGVRMIEHQTFNFSTKLQAIYMPESVKVIGENAFGKSITEIVCYAINPPVPSTIYTTNTPDLGISDICKIFVPSESLNLYINDDFWSKYKEQIYPIE